MGPLRPDQVAFRALYKEMVETDTSYPKGSCTLLAERIAMSTGATDGIYLEAIGIPVYGVPGFWGDPDGNGVHGLNERRSLRAMYVGRDFLNDLIKAYADAQ